MAQKAPPAGERRPAGESKKTDKTTAWLKKNWYVPVGGLAVLGIALYEKKKNAASSTNAAASSTGSSGSGGYGGGYTGSGFAGEGDVQGQLSNLASTVTSTRAQQHQTLSSQQSQITADKAAISREDEAIAALQADVAALKNAPDKKAAASSTEGTTVGNAVPGEKTTSSGANSPAGPTGVGTEAAPGSSMDQLLADTTSANTAGKGKTDLDTEGNAKASIDKAPEAVHPSSAANKPKTAPAKAADAKTVAPAAHKTTAKR
jgi:hypothetical protein